MYIHTYISRPSAAPRCRGGPRPCRRSPSEPPHWAAPVSNAQRGNGIGGKLS